MEKCWASGWPRSCGSFPCRSKTPMGSPRNRAGSPDGWTWTGFVSRLCQATSGSRCSERRGVSSETSSGVPTCPESTGRPLRSGICRWSTGWALGPNSPTSCGRCRASWGHRTRTSWEATTSRSRSGSRVSSVQTFTSMAGCGRSSGFRVATPGSPMPLHPCLLPASTSRRVIDWSPSRARRSTLERRRTPRWWIGRAGPSR
ncbi:hypothetical protein BMS3Bbin01_00181 [bacterium BMS3Bbin01]|nr:hypothetical protein BMS3Bbin01_00181 [bacterium BMS3Bbin01]